MQPEPEYGPRLSNEEYESRILDLYRNLPPMPSADQDREVRRQELDLGPRMCFESLQQALDDVAHVAIQVFDHRLGQNFPADRRSALWAAQQSIEKKRLRLGMKYLLRRLTTAFFSRNAQSLAGYAAEEYAKVLSPEELKRFLDLKEGEPPVLPVDIQHAHK